MEQDNHGNIWIHGHIKIPVEQYHSQVVTGSFGGHELYRWFNNYVQFNMSLWNYVLYHIFGCTDPTALNYDSTATIDDGSCIA